MNEALFNTPVLLILYNRPDLTFRVFDSVKKIRPKRLYIAADGPKSNNQIDEALCLQVRSVVNRVNWECSLNTSFQVKNLGCKNHVSKAISWFFDNEEEGIILEDDCLPNKTFFNYCAQLLEKYRYDISVGHIGGNNFKKESKPGSYFFSKYSFIWGWASWRRAWRLYDPDITSFPDTLLKNKMAGYFNSAFEKYTFYNKFLQVYTNSIDTWDYQWLYTLWMYNLKSIVPPVNLVKKHRFRRKSNPYQTFELVIETTA